MLQLLAAAVSVGCTGVTLGQLSARILFLAFSHCFLPLLMLLTFQVLPFGPIRATNKCPTQHRHDWQRVLRARAKLISTIVQYSENVPHKTRHMDMSFQPWECATSQKRNSSMTASATCWWPRLHSHDQHSLADQWAPQQIPGPPHRVMHVPGCGLCAQPLDLGRWRGAKTVMKTR